MPELPEAREQRLVDEYGIPLEDAVVLAAGRDVADYFEAVARTAGDGKASANWVMTEVLHLAKASEQGLGGVRVGPEQLGRMIRLIGEGTITGKIGKVVFAEMAKTGEEPRAIVEARGLVQIEDEEELERIVGEVLNRNPGPVEEYIHGKDAALQFFMGQVMKATGGRANPRAARETVKRALDERGG
jgi:aspartyl-tRNA(Asn)/glutamyl-tRNA(Gln) amidotransferase subunit B